MGRKEWESSGGEFDTFEKGSPRKPSWEQTRGKPTDHRVSISKYNQKISYVRRHVEIGDARRLNRIGQQALIACGRRPKEQKRPEDYALTLLPARNARTIYYSRFHDRRDPHGALDQFNAQAAEFIRTDRERKIATVVRLGDIVVLETVTPHVAAMIVEGEPMGSDEIREQLFRLQYHLTGDAKLSRGATHSETFPSISFGRFDDLDSAKAFRRALIDQGTELFIRPVTINPPSIDKVLL